MKSKKLQLLAPLAGLCFCAEASVPTVSNVTTRQDTFSREVTVNYTLSDEPGIVTLTAQTNRGDGVWVDVADSNLAFVSGDANKVVPVGDHALTWLPHKSWPDRLIVGGNIRIGVKAWATNAPPDYIVVSLTIPNTAHYYTCPEAMPGGVQDERYKTTYLVMRKCPAANVTWLMGSPETESGRYVPQGSGHEDYRISETPHEVTLSSDYYIGVYPVTQRQYALMIGTKPSFFNLESEHAMRPVELVSYNELRGSHDWPSEGHAVSDDCFIGKLRAFTGIEGFDFPTDAQWEFACRAGSGGALYNGQELDEVYSASVRLNVFARNYWNGGSQASQTCTAEFGTAKVGSYVPNAWGIYDMLGNVWEWCLDWYQDSPTGYDVATGPSSGSERVVRGGSWNELPLCCRCARRRNITPTMRNSAFGFRMCCPAAAK